MRRLHELSALAIAAITLTAIYWIGTSGGWHYDDNPNLWALKYVDTPLAAAHYVFSGEAGPTGRPLSMLSFALQARSYPDAPDAMLRVNVALHVFNFILVYLLLARLTRMVWPGDPRNGWFALTAASLWAFSPLLMGTTLMAVQRMALLSATFVLLGVNVYLKGREVSSLKPIRGAQLWVGGLVGGTVLASLAKENGALLPLFVICIHYFLLQPKGWALQPKWRRLHLAALWLPAFVIVAYLLWIGIVQPGYAHRDFTLWERLLTQTRALWDYVFSLLLPRTDVATPFSDNFQLSTGLLSPLTTIFSVLGWALAGVLAVALRRWSLVPLFGLCWFLSGHVVESTTPPLELYFAHRNYVPSIGIWILLTWFVFQGLPSQRLVKWTVAGTAAYASLMALVLFSAASLWGKPRLASEMWLIQNEDSLRAAQFIANAHVQENDDLVADRIMKTAQQHHPGDMQIDLQRLSYCTGNKEEYRGRYQRVLERIEQDPEIGLAGMAGLGYLAQLAIADHCPFLHPKDIRRLVEASSPQSGMPRVTRLATRQKLVTQARLDLHDGVYERAVETYVLALKTDPNPYLLKSLGSSLVAWGLGPILRDHLHELSMIQIKRPFGQKLWDQTLAELTIPQSEQPSSTDGTSNEVR